ncbi:MAG TPA: right-handed parallel beta-helix repeat-containing protein [Gemmatimonadales bacterium]|nr:right-handed parallel beta-helix repeat-containing protein [Gemmatimonadales bacterium]
MRRIVGSLALLILLAAPARGQQALVGMYPATVGLDSGQQATIPLVIDMRAVPSNDLGAYQLVVSWDPAVLRYVRTAGGAFGTPTVNAASAATGSLTLAGTSVAGFGGLFSVAQLTFEMLVPSGSSPVAVASPELTASVTFSSIPVTAVPGSVCTTAGTWGDVNHDGQILSNDALLVVTAAVGLSIAPYTLVNADVDNDGDGDTRDALIILSSAVGLSTTGFRVGTPNASGCGGAAAASLALAPGSLTLASGDVAPVTATVLDSAGNPTSARGLVWSTDASGVATVDSSGSITAVSNGTATITAMAIGVTPQPVAITVQDRHTWYVDAVAGAGHTIFLGSPAYPFPDVQAGLDHAAPNDTVRIARASVPYGAAVISKPVIVIGDSTAGGMPHIQNSSGPAILANASGRVSLRNLFLDLSNAGLDARVDTLNVRSITATSLRGPGFSVHKAQVATFTGIGVNSAVIAGLVADSNGAVSVSGADIRVIASRNDSVAGLAVAHGDSAIVTNLAVLGVANGQAALFVGLARGSLTGFSAQAAGGVTADSVGSLTLALGTIQSGGGSSDQTIGVHADTVTIDTVVVSDVDRGVALSPVARDTVTHSSAVATITRSSFTNIRNDGALTVDRFGRLDVSHLTVRGVAQNAGVDVRRVGDVRIDSSVVLGVANGAAISVDPTATLTMHTGHLRGLLGGLFADGVRTVSLSNIEVDSSAANPALCFFCSVRFGIAISRADSVRLDSLNLHDNTGGGVLVDSARVVVGSGSVVVRNQGFGSGGIDCGPECNIGNRGSPARSTPVLQLGSYVQFTSGSGPGVVLNTVHDSRLDQWTMQDNQRGAIMIAGWDSLTAPTARISNSAFRGVNTRMISIAGNSNTPDGALTVQGGTFALAGEGIDASYLKSLTVSGAAFDSIGDGSSPVVFANLIDTVAITDNAVSRSFGYAFRVLNGLLADVLRNNVANQYTYSTFLPEAVVELGNVDSGVVSQNRILQSHVRGVLTYGGGAHLVVVDSNVVMDSAGVAIDVGRPMLIRKNRIHGNYNGIFVGSGGESSVITANNFEANVFDAIRWIASIGTVNAQGNWWNATDGPQCNGGLTGCVSTTGDFVDGPAGTIDFSGFLTTPDGSVPLSPPVLRSQRAVTGKGTR